MQAFSITPDLVRAALVGLPNADSPWLSLLRTKARLAAVALPIRFEQQPFVVAFLRSSTLRDHAGQVAFPGGKKEEADRDLLATALREAHEEVGLGEDVELLGRLTPTPVYSGRYLIHPYVVSVPNDVEPVARSTEIARLLRLPILPYLTGELPIHGLSLPWQDGAITMPHFWLGEGLAMYGASAVIFYELLERIATALGITLPACSIETTFPWGDGEPPQ